MEILLVGIIFLFILVKNQKISTKKFIEDNQRAFKGLKEDDYEFLAKATYGNDVDIDKLFSQRVKSGVIVILFLTFMFLSKLNYLNILAVFVAGFFVFKSQYSKLKSAYKRRLHDIELELPKFLKNMEVLIQHYTVPVAIAKSIKDAPIIFKPGLENLTEKINSGDSTIDPYMEFARAYPVGDSTRMMRLLYRLGLGTQENKQERLLMFSRSVSVLQNKARETKYKERLGVMENKTMVMLGATGGGIMILLLISMMQSFTS